jgi:hypothetical protein
MKQQRDEYAGQERLSREERTNSSTIYYIIILCNVSCVASAAEKISMQWGLRWECKNLVFWSCGILTQRVKMNMRCTHEIFEASAPCYVSSSGCTCPTTTLVLLLLAVHFFFSRTLKRTACHYIKKKKWDKNPYKTHQLRPLCSKQTDMPLTHKVGDLNPKLTPIQPQGKEVIGTSCPCQAPIKKFLTSDQQSSS